MLLLSFRGTLISNANLCTTSLVLLEEEIYPFAEPETGRLERGLHEVPDTTGQFNFDP
jgi:hypothetical protein